MKTDGQKMDSTMENRGQLVRHTITLLLAFGVIASMLPSFAAEQGGLRDSRRNKNGIPVMPLSAPPENSLAWEVAKKPAIESKLLSDMETLENWELWVDKSGNHRSYGTISPSMERCYKGRASLLLTSPTKGEPNFPSSRGRPWGSASAIFK